MNGFGDPDYIFSYTHFGKTAMAERGRPRNFNKAEALDRAMEVFWRKGFEASSMADLISAMGIGSTSIYAAFGAKEDLFRAVVEHYVETVGADIWKAVAEAQTAFGAIEGFLMTTARAFTSRKSPSGCLVVLSALHENESNEAVRRELVAKREQNVHDLAKIISAGLATGEISPDADLPTIARFFVTVQEGMSIQARDGASRVMLEKIARAALTAWRPLITPNDSSSG